MLERIVLGTFIVGLLAFLGLGQPITSALLFGYAVFFVYSIIKKHTVKDILTMSLSGVKTIKNILVVYFLIGMLTAVWRASGTIPFIIYYSTKLIVPEIFILVAFLLCCVVSVLTGTALGTAATIGVICMAMANTMGQNELFVGGAILSGIYFGDRCSPMSTSALITSELTGTDIFKNIRLMIKTSIVPLILASLVFLGLGFISGGKSASSEMIDLFAENFDLNIFTVLPAALIFILSAFKLKVKYTMAISIVAASIICLLLQKTQAPELLSVFVFGFHPADAQLASLLSGGGILSMLNVTMIVLISSSYAGIFEGTGLLRGIKDSIHALAAKISVFGAIAATSALTAMISCNQTLTIILTHQLCKDLTDDKYELSISLENTAVIIPPLIPWTTSSTVTLAAAGAPLASILTACYLYIMPTYNFFYQKKLLSSGQKDDLAAGKQEDPNITVK